MTTSSQTTSQNTHTVSEAPVVAANTLAFNPTLTDIISVVGLLISALGLATIIAGLIFIGRKLQILDDLKTTSDKIKANVKVIGDFLTRNNSNFNPAELQAFSPLRLTEQGEEFIKNTGFEEVFRAHKDDFFMSITGEKPKLKYDVEIAAIKSISFLYDKEYMNFLKILFYNNPERNMENTAPTFGIYVRDEYLREHPEITE